MRSADLTYRLNLFLERQIMTATIQYCASTEYIVNHILDISVIDRDFADQAASEWIYCFLVAIEEAGFRAVQANTTPDSHDEWSHKCGFRHSGRGWGTRDHLTAGEVMLLNNYSTQAACAIERTPAFQDRDIFSDYGQTMHTSEPWDICDEESGEDRVQVNNATEPETFKIIVTGENAWAKARLVVASPVMLSQLCETAAQLRDLADPMGDELADVRDALQSRADAIDNVIRQTTGQRSVAVDCE